MRPAKTNKIIEAGNRLTDEDHALLDEDMDDSDENSEAREYDQDDVSVDEMFDVIEKLPAAAKARIDATRKKGTATHRATPAHTTRAKQESREPTHRARIGEWNPADTLYAPPSRPGMEQRWIRIRLGEKDDPRNFQKKFREGWKPVKISNVPEDLEPPTSKFGAFGEVVAVSDLVLCERPIEIGINRKRFFAKRLQRQLLSADRRHVNKVQRDDHVIVGGAKSDMKPSVGRGTRNRSAPVQGDDE